MGPGDGKDAGLASVRACGDVVRESGEGAIVIGDWLGEGRWVLRRVRPVGEGWLPFAQAGKSGLKAQHQAA